MAHELDCVVVGGGVAGLATALVLGRARRPAVVVDHGGQSNRPAPHIGGLLGQDGVRPADFYAAGRAQIAAHEAVSFRDGKVVDARAADGRFAVALSDGRELQARTLVLATGMDYEVPAIAGFRELWGNAVFHCPFCHGWEVRDRAVVVCAPVEAAERFARLLGSWTDDVTVVAPADVAKLRVEAGELRGVIHRDGSHTPCDAILVHAPLSRRGDLPERLGLELTDDGIVAVDAQMRTSVPGVYAAGDLAVAPQQVAIALASGHMAGIAVIRELTFGRG